MFFRIMKKELMRKKGINTILFLFIIIATIFVASSVNNIIVVSNATEYCMDKGNVPVENVWTYETDTTTNLDDWLEGAGGAYITKYIKNETIVVSQSNIASFNNEEGTAYHIASSIFLCSQWKEYMQIFTEDQKLADPHPGELSMQRKEMEQNHLQPGDTITLTFGSLTKEFTLTEPIMDPALGGDYVGMTRYLINKEDYQEIEEAGATKSYTYGIETEQLTQFSKELNKQGIAIVVELGRDVFKMTYIMSMISAGILIILGVCLIVIAFLILRFTILVTLQEDYRQIGIMKAIGIRERGIKKLYLIKYFAIALIGTTLGCVLSVPASTLMLKSVASGMMMQDGSANPLIPILCGVLVLALVMGFSDLVTNRLRKYSAIDAIRGGQSGERYHKKFLLSLSRHKSSVPLFLAVNDILSGVKKYIVLVLTFMIGTILIILPLNTMTTMQSKEMAKNFVMDTDSDFYINPDTVFRDKYTITRESALETIQEVENEFAEKGYATDLNTMVFYSAPVSSEADPEDVRSMMAMQFVGNDVPVVALSEGSLPVESDELAMSEKAMKKLGLSLGDYVLVKIDGREYRMIITGTYENYMQMGVSMLLSNQMSTGAMYVSGNWYLQGKFTKDNQTLENLKQDFSQYEFYDMQEAMGKQLGSTITQIDVLKNGIVLLICGINALITILMMKIFIMGEKSQLAMLRSIGFSVRAVRFSQTLRMALVLLIGVVLGTLLSIPLNAVGVKPVFAMMGAGNIKIQTNPLENYLIYPGVLLLVVVITAYRSSASIKRLNLMEINNVE